MFRILKCIQKHSLSKQNALKRSKCFYPSSNNYHQDTIKYTYNLALHPGTHYQGIAQIKFKLQKIDNIFLDFNGKQIKSIIINQKQISLNNNNKNIYRDGKIQIEQNILKVGQNNICIKYENQYDKDGSGCVSFIDVDKKQYLYTQFQPYMGNRVFPMFDQPDLKAKMQLAIACPSQWQAVLSNQNQLENNNSKDNNNSNSNNNRKQLIVGSSVCKLTQKIIKQFQSQLPTNYKITSFPTTKLLPTYLFCFVVGPYKKYISTNTYKNLPMNLYCIQSLYPYMMKLVPFIEQMTNKSMQFFQQYFGYPYPFNKYDQVFAHEYKWGAMQNAGIVTLNDLYIFKDPVSVEKMINFGNTIIHEMAHHWFGNLVTMKWWDDLWLNQSFAEYISHFCLQKIKNNVTTINYQSAMASFLNRKGWGYQQDQLVTTHPIRSNVANTQVAQSIFDGITYSKGAATMKQLMYLMGEDNFSKALKEYFHDYQFKNAQLQDLLKYMKKHYKVKDGVTIDQWRQMWLQKAGLNILSYNIDKNNSILKIKQIPYHNNHPTLRSHTLKIALVQNPKKIQQIQIIVKPQQITQIKLTQQQLNKFNKAQAVLLNYQDLSFVKVIIDQKSIKYFKQHLNQIQNVLFRSMVWKNFYDMVKDGLLKSTQYIQILANNLFLEKSDAILQENLNYALVSIQKYTPKQKRSKLLNIMLNKCNQSKQDLNKNQNKNRGIIIRDKLISFSDTNSIQNMTALSDWFYQKSQQLVSRLGVSNITQKWKIVIKILSSKLINKETKKKLLQNMISKDNSDTMKNKKLTCEGLLLQQSQIQEYFKRHTEDPNQKWGMTSFIHSLSGLNSKIHEQSIRENLKDKYFSIIKTALSGKQHNLPVLNKSQMIELFIDHMDPNIQDNIEDLKWKKQEFKKIKVENNDKIKIQIMKKIDLLNKRIKCFELYNRK